MRRKTYRISSRTTLERLLLQLMIFLGLAGLLFATTVPLFNAVLQSNLNGAGNSATNFNQFTATNAVGFVGNATSANFASTTTYATNAGYATNSGFATNAGYSTNAGYAAYAGYATNLVGSPSLLAGTNIFISGAWPNQTINSSGGSSGSVTNFISGNLSPLFTTSVSNSTNYPSLSFSLSSTSQNYVLAGPTSGSGAPNYRALVAADVPTLNQNTTGTAANLSGTPALPNGVTATTQSAGDNSTKLATTAYVNSYAPLASPTFTGTPSLPTGTTATTQTSTDNSTKLATTAFVQTAVSGLSGPVGFRNRIINGDMAINQRGVTTIPTGSATSTTYSLDRWYAFATTSGCTVAQVTTPFSSVYSQFQYGMKFTGSTSNAGLEWGQKIEAQNIFDLANSSSSIELSCYMVASASTTVTWTVYSPGSLDTWSSSRSSVQSGTFSVTTTPQRFSANVYSGLGALQNGAEVAFSVSALGNAATITTTGVQFEPSLATTFEKLPANVELAQCQRYYAQAALYYNTAYVLGYGFPVTMRTTPMVSNGPSGNQTINLTPNAFYYSATSGSGSNTYYFSAEL